MTQRSIARSYAWALADTLEGDAALRRVEVDLAEFARVMQAHGELRQFLTGPLVPLERRVQAAHAVLKAGRVGTATRNFVALLLERHRAGLASEIAEEFSALVRERLKIVAAEVTSARRLSKQAQDKARASLARLTGCEVRAEFRVDPTLLGGLRTRVGSTVYDGSVRGRLERLRDRMTSGSGR